MAKTTAPILDSTSPPVVGELLLQRSAFRLSYQSRPVSSNTTRTIRMTPIRPTPP